MLFVVQRLNDELCSVAERMAVLSIVICVWVNSLVQMRVAFENIVGQLVIVVSLLDVASRQGLLPVFRFLTVVSN